MSTGSESVASARDDYPRPQLVRPHWRDLTGPWGFALDDDEIGLDEEWWRPDHRLPLSIVVPFPPESSASGIGADGIHDVVWYQREIDGSDVSAAGFDARRRPRLVLHFGAVDYRCTVWFDGQRLGDHEGGHTPFSLELPSIEETGTHTITVRAEDRAADVAQPRGKQDWQPEPHVIWYRRTTGIWQPVWLEATAHVSIEKIHWTPDIPRARVVCEIRLSAPVALGARAEIVLRALDETIGQVDVTLTGQRTSVTIDLPRQANGQAHEELLWSPESPTLVDATVTVGDDRVTSYFGLRSVGVALGSFLLNERPMYLRSVLSQGYWPASQLAAPSPAALREEVEWILKLGFNSARVHQKMEDPRFLYWADRLGLMLWAEAPAAFEYSAVAVERTTREWLDVLDRDRSHPSIVTWVPLNESWGVQHIAHDSRQVAFARALVSLTRAIDPTRPVISNDGWEHVDSDIFSIHDYESDRAILTARYAGDGLRERLLSGIGPAGRRLSVAGRISEEAPIMVTEFGGIDFSPGAAPDDAWGYSSASSADDFRDRVAAVYAAIQSSTEVVGSCYTQLTDTMQETNGLLTEDRVPKLDVALIRSIVQGRYTAPGPSS